MNIVCIIIKFQLFEQQNMERVVREYGRNRSTDLEIITGGYRTLMRKIVLWQYFWKCQIKESTGTQSPSKLYLN
jgi:hypothetical protein